VDKDKFFTLRSFFSNRVINVRNGLPQHVVDAKTVNMFKT